MLGQSGIAFRFRPCGSRSPFRERQRTRRCGAGSPGAERVLEGHFFYPRFPCRRAPRTYGCTAPRVPVFVCPPAPARRWAAAGRMRSDRHLTPTARGMMRTEWSLAPRARLVRRCRRRCAAGPSVGESCGRPVSGCLRRPMGYSTADPM